MESPEERPGPGDADGVLRTDVGEQMEAYQAAWEEDRAAARRWAEAARKRLEERKKEGPKGIWVGDPWPDADQEAPWEEALSGNKESGADRGQNRARE